MSESDSASVASSPQYSVVIPLFNEAGCIEELHDRLWKVMTGISEEFEIIYVNDGSTDGTDTHIDRLAAADERVKVIHFSRNFGQHPAVYAGFARACGPTVITLDGDLQNPPEEIPKLLRRTDREKPSRTRI